MGYLVAGSLAEKRPSIPDHSLDNHSDLVAQLCGAERGYVEGLGLNLAFDDSHGLHLRFGVQVGRPHIFIFAENVNQILLLIIFEEDVLEEFGDDAHHFLRGARDDALDVDGFAVELSVDEAPSVLDP